MRRSLATARILSAAEVTFGIIGRYSYVPMYRNILMHLHLPLLAGVDEFALLAEMPHGLAASMVQPLAYGPPALAAGVWRTVNKPSEKCSAKRGGALVLRAKADTQNPRRWREKNDLA